MIADGSPATATPRGVVVSTAVFEGPLDLLLHVIRTHEIDILDIPIALVAAEYLAYIEAMDPSQLSLAGDYLAMATTLLHLKSRMLLPDDTTSDEPDAADVTDPRAALVERLLVYRMYRDAAAALDERPRLDRDVFGTGIRAPAATSDARAPVAAGHPLDLARALATLRRRAPEATWHEVTRERMAIRDLILDIADRLAVSPRTTLRDLAGAGAPTERWIGLFLALLEMARLRLVRLFQLRLLSDDLSVEQAVVDPGAYQEMLTLAATEPEMKG